MVNPPVLLTVKKPLLISVHPMHSSTAWYGRTTAIRKKGRRLTAEKNEEGLLVFRAAKFV